VRRTAEMTDRGVYETLNLAPLRPGRSPAHAHDLDYVIAVDAGRRRSPKPTSALTPFRLARSFDITYNRTQDASGLSPSFDAIPAIPSWR
jgi:NTE family protein